MKALTVLVSAILMAIVNSAKVLKNGLLEAMIASVKTLTYGQRGRFYGLAMFSGMVGFFMVLFSIASWTNQGLCVASVAITLVASALIAIFLGYALLEKVEEIISERGELFLRS